MLCNFHEPKHSTSDSANGECTKCYQLMSMSSVPEHMLADQRLNDSCTDVQAAAVVITKISIVIPFFASTFLISAVNSLSFESTAEVFMSEDSVTE